jgi:hypothetical protein
MSSEVVRAYKRVHFLKTKLFIYQLRIGTKSAFEFHNYRLVQISVILSNLKIKQNHLKLFCEHVH